MLEFRQVRGAAFPHTAARELVMSGRVADALAPLDAAGANTPVALMTYARRHVHSNHPIARQLTLFLADTRLLRSCR